MGILRLVQHNSPIRKLFQRKGLGLRASPRDQPVRNYREKVGRQPQANFGPWAGRNTRRSPAEGRNRRASRAARQPQRHLFVVQNAHSALIRPLYALWNSILAVHCWQSGLRYQQRRPECYIEGLALAASGVSASTGSSVGGSATDRT
jgi:hypothetical protein